MVFYDLRFEREYPDREDTEVHIGIYATEVNAAGAVGRLRDQPGFRGFSNGFKAYPVTLGVAGWQEGFVTGFMPAQNVDATDRPA